jgi:hydroxymethylpyrimidine/phosphomethylpyrimidine kinase
MSPGSEQRMHVVTALTIAGSDSGGGAGIQADLKTFLCRGVYGMSALTALTAQNTLGVQGVHLVPPDFVTAQLRSVFDDLPVHAIKIGMVGDAPRIEAVADFLERLPQRPPIVLDPVMIAKGGAPLLDPDAAAALVARLVPLATVVTPNLPEAAVLGSLPGAAVLRKGGHGEGPVVVDLLEIDGREVARWEHPRVATKNTHGTGCTLAACLAAELAKGAGLVEACGTAVAYVGGLVKAGGVQVGGGCGPVGGGWAV